MSKLGLPNDFQPPEDLQTNLFALEPLSPKHNEMDFEAWNSSRESLKGIFGPGNSWPDNVQTLEENMRDLEKHFDEFQKGIAFAYTILTAQRDRCIGCLYIRPPRMQGYDCHVEFWFRDDTKEMEDGFQRFLDLWLKRSWKFVNIAYPGRSLRWSDYLGN